MVQSAIVSAVVSSQHRMASAPAGVVSTVGRLVLGAGMDGTGRTAATGSLAEPRRIMMMDTLRMTAATRTPAATARTRLSRSPPPDEADHLVRDAGRSSSEGGAGDADGGAAGGAAGGVAASPPTGPDAAAGGAGTAM
jgi:hypothetical protein